MWKESLLCKGVYSGRPFLVWRIKKTSQRKLRLKNQLEGTSLAVQWLRLCAFIAVGVGRSLVGELRSHKPLSMTKKQTQRTISTKNEHKSFKSASSQIMTNRQLIKLALMEFCCIFWPSQKLNFGFFSPNLLVATKYDGNLLCPKPICGIRATLSKSQFPNP